MKFIVSLFFVTSVVFAQSACEDFMTLLGQRDINSLVVDFRENCGPFEETISEDGMTKTWSSKEKGIEITFVNRAKDQFALPKFEVMMLELTSFTNSGGYKQDFPFGFKMGMDHKMVKSHIEQLKSVIFEKKNLGKTSSSFVYTGSPNSALQNRQIKVSIVQFDGKNISAMRLRLK